MTAYRIAVTGCRGRMGGMIARAVADHPEVVLAGGTEKPGSGAVGADLGELLGMGRLDAPVTDDPPTLFAHADAVIDFTLPQLTAQHAELAAQAETVLVIGTTGLSRDQQAGIERAARHTRIVQAPNMSLGVNLLLTLVKQVAQALDPAFDVEITEMHHRHKKDAPSGTALALGRAAADGRGVNLDDVADRGRDGDTGPRREGDIGFAAVRGGEVAGEHTVCFAGANERIELTHKADSRGIFAQGAITAAQWARNRDPGLYSMQDVLGLT